MSRLLISLSPDLKRLSDEGYHVEIRGAHLLLRQIPYVNRAREVRYGTLVTALNLAGDRTITPADHTVLFAGEVPCDRHGQPLDRVINNSNTQDLGGGLIVNHLFSSKPAGGYPDYYVKMTAYVGMISAPAISLDASVTATPFPVIKEDAAESPFVYRDTASSRAGITAASEKFRGHRVAIVGVGGTGAYILDLVSKTEVAEIHTFDGDLMRQHNAFRAPGAAALEQLQVQLPKVEYYADIYTKIHRGVVPHAYAITANTVSELKGMDFVFLAIDDNDAKPDILAFLEAHDIAYVDVGMGLHIHDGAIAGILRVTKSTPQQREHVYAKNRIPLSAVDIDNQYGHNIQVADLNALNATLAVIAWKKHLTFYRDLDREHFMTYTIDGNQLLNEDHAS